MLQYSEDGKMTWGFACDTVRNKFQWFKLEQDPKYKTEQLEQALPAGTLRPQSEQQAKDLITQYLELLRIHVEKSVKDHLDTGGKRQSALLRDVRWEYIITVPAMWPESAQNITEKCAKEAGMAHSLPVKIIPEPEAAGIYALARMCEELELEIGDTFVICDAGGGWVLLRLCFLGCINANYQNTVLSTSYHTESPNLVLIRSWKKQQQGLEVFADHHS